MRATGLRIVSGFVACAALVAGALIATPKAWADEATLKGAFDDYAAGKYEDALKKLQEYVASNPGDDEVYRVLRSVDERVKLQALSAGGDHERLMRYLLDKARPAVEARKRDPDAIKKLVEQALSGEIDVRRRASLELATRSGDYAVPYLLPALGAAEPEKVVNAIFAFHAIGGEAVLPLSEAMSSSDARLRGFVAVVLGDIRDPRALPVLRRAAETDGDEAVKGKAQAAIQKIRGAGPAMTAAASYVRFGQLYFANDPTVISEPDQVHNLWRWEGDGLVRYEVPAPLYRYQLAQMQAVGALALEPANMAARSLLVRSVLAQMLEGSLLGEKAPEALKGAWDLAASQGFDAASAALGDAIQQRTWDVAAAACRLCAATYGAQGLAGHPLGQALASSEKRVQYAAAIALLRMSPAGPVDNGAQVPALAAQAAAEQAIRQVFVIDDQDGPRARMVQDLREANYVVADERDGFRGVARLKGAPTVDVVVVRADLGAGQTIPMERWRSTLAVIDEVLADIRTKNMRVVVVVGGENPDKIAEKKSFLSTKYGDKIAGFVEEPLVTSAYMPTVEAAVAKGELNKERDAALKIAAEAADALASTHAHGAGWDLRVAVDPLAADVEKGATDEIKMNAVRALGNIQAGGGAALVGVLKSADAKEDLKVAAAKALGSVLSRVAPAADEVDTLVATAKTPGALGSAAMQALGQVKDLSPEVARTVFGEHRLDVGTKGE